MPVKTRLTDHPPVIDIGIHSEGKHEGYKFATGAALNSIDISDNLKTAVEGIDETSLKGMAVLDWYVQGLRNWW
jgi:hypothetical protein